MRIEKQVKTIDSRPALSNTHVASGPILCGYFKIFEVKIIILNRALRYFCFKLVGKCQLLLIILPNINSHLGVEDSNLGIKHPYTHIKLRHGL